jgi:beta-glucanase (GH16 family)
MRIFPTIAAICMSLRLTGESLAEEAADEYQLVWSDEFNEDGPPNAENWGFERGFVRNEELQWYRPENARCENGLLVIEARRERLENPRFDPERGDSWRNRPHAEYTSASLQTRGRQTWRYGRFEMRGRIDTRAGLWPAWWMLGTERGWPAGGEIDMMEYYDGQLLANVAWLGRRRWQARWDDSKRPLAEFGDPDWSKKFHTWRMDWDAQQIKLYVDDTLLNTTDLARTVNADREAANPFHERHYMLLNLAIGGTRGGDPSATVFPARFEVDYVRVYQKPEESERPSATGH